MDNPEIHAIFGTMHRTKAGKTKNSAKKPPNKSIMIIIPLLRIWFYVSLSAKCFFYSKL